MRSLDRVLLNSHFLCSHHVVILHFSKNYFSEVLFILKVYNNTPLYGPMANGVSIDCTSHVCLFVVLVAYRLSEIEEFKFRVETTGIKPTPDRHDQPYMRSLHVYRAKNA
jgi:hypothetical protein